MKILVKASVVVVLIAVLLFSVRSESKGGRKVLLSIRCVDLICLKAGEYKQAHGHYPATLSELVAADAQIAGWVNDGWGREIVYRIVPVEAGSIELRSAGADGVMNTQDDIVATVLESHEYGRKD